jgi:colanic acid/amylovoran biosynthesis protein
MKKIYLRCVYRKNLGDDIFIYLLCNRYANSFFTLNYSGANIVTPIENLKVININFNIYRIFRKISSIFNKRNFLETLALKYFKIDSIILIGGSLFMEPKNYRYDLKDVNLKWYDKINKDSYIIGANIGPVYSETYIKNMKEQVFAKSKDICLRDAKSYEYVKELSNVRYASDIVFSLDVSKYLNINEEKKVIISVIDLIKKARQIKNPNLEKYEECICCLIESFINKGYKVELMSFCKEEGDEIAINRILSNSKYSSQVSKYFYDGDIYDAIRELSTAKVIVGTRFHANILGLILNKTILPISYNDKTINMLNDLNFKGKIIDINDMDNFDSNSITYEDLNYKLDVSFQKKDAERHFEVLDKVLERRNTNE